MLNTLHNVYDKVMTRRRIIPTRLWAIGPAFTSNTSMSHNFVIVLTMLRLFYDKVMTRRRFRPTRLERNGPAFTNTTTTSHNFVIESCDSHGFYDRVMTRPCATRTARIYLTRRHPSSFLYNQTRQRILILLDNLSITFPGWIPRPLGSDGVFFI